MATGMSGLVHPLSPLSPPSPPDPRRTPARHHPLTLPEQVPRLSRWPGSGAVGWARQCHTEIAEIVRIDPDTARTAEPSGQPATVPGESLTAEELQIARLAAEGLDDGEIGDRFLLTRGTVSHRLDGICRKLGLHSRHELTGQLLAMNGF